MTTSAAKQIDALTSLRFFAALYVLLFHSGSNWLSGTGRAPAFVVNFLRNGYLGVSFFFVLSGFILAYVYHDSAMRAPELRRFARSRFARVYPALFLSLILMIPFVEVRPLRSSVWQFFMLQSWLPPAFRITAANANWNMQAWTLSVELFFYIVFPLMLVRTRRLSDRSVVAGIIAICAVIMSLRLPEIRGDEHLLFDWMAWLPIPVLRTPEFLYGVCLGVLFVRGRIRSSPVLLGAVSVTTIVLLSVSSSLWVAPVSAILFGGVIALTPGGLSKGGVSRCLTSPLLVLLGQASYAVYILQLPIRFYIRDYFEAAYPFAARLAYMPALVLISILTLRYFEEPARDLIRRNLSVRRPEVDVAPRGTT